MTYGSRAGAPSIKSNARFLLAPRTLYTQWTTPQYRVALQGAKPHKAGR